MTTKEELRRIRAFPDRRRIERYQRAVSRQYPASPLLSDMPKNPNVSDKLADATAIKMEELNRLNQYFEEHDKLHARAWDETMNIRDPYAQAVIVLYYFDRLPNWDAVAKVMNCDRSTALRWHGKALKILRKMRLNATLQCDKV